MRHVDLSCLSSGPASSCLVSRRSWRPPLCLSGPRADGVCTAGVTWAMARKLVRSLGVPVCALLARYEPREVTGQPTLTYRSYRIPIDRKGGYYYGTNVGLLSCRAINVRSHFVRLPFLIRPLAARKFFMCLSKSLSWANLVASTSCTIRFK